LTFADASILATLDELEDFDGDRHATENLYYRQPIEVFDLTQQSLGFAWIYLMTVEQVQKFAAIPQPNGCWHPEDL
jgi:gamma-glutamylcyclotransferase (GGCT)/AIG2-like uncharacterized protein YtfP